jgi:hypothetical protein
MEDRYDAIYEIVSENQPTGIRFTYYAAVARGIVPKNDSGYRKVQLAILDMRRDGTIPWDWIVDTTRWMRKPTTWGSPEEALEEVASTYRRALWLNAPVTVEVWCESESVAGVLDPVTAKWDVPLYPIKGQTSDSFAWAAAQNYRNDPRDLVIYYVGDHDPAGYQIETNLQAKLIEHSGREIRWTRLACDAGDVERLDLAGTPPKQSHYRNAMTGERVPWHGPAVEVEAIDPPLLRRWLDDWIERHTDPDALRVLQATEQREREILMRMAGEWSA